jgi:addiction module RelB/DinJ family antitoxin
MKTLFRARVDKRLLREAQQICSEMGLDTQEAFRIFLAALVHRREMPFKLTTETPEDELLQPRNRRAQILQRFHPAPKTSRTHKATAALEKKLRQAKNSKELDCPPDFFTEPLDN